MRTIVAKAQRVIIENHTNQPGHKKRSINVAGVRLLPGFSNEFALSEISAATKELIEEGALFMSPVAGKTTAQAAPAKTDAGEKTPEAPKGDAGEDTPEAPKGDAGEDTPEAPEGDAGEDTPEAPEGDAGENTPEAPEGGKKTRPAKKPKKK